MPLIMTGSGTFAIRNVSAPNKTWYYWQDENLCMKKFSLPPILSVVLSFFIGELYRP
ncbi:hypothetical protein [Brassicibacter mesophilus]|uniref:hypothetical protein n=1 Tax=Brassicibacter mesophilus TaxID=745119 RepID=UPI003D24B4DA